MAEWLWHFVAHKELSGPSHISCSQQPSWAHRPPTVVGTKQHTKWGSRDSEKLRDSPNDMQLAKSRSKRETQAVRHEDWEPCPPGAWVICKSHVGYASLSDHVIWPTSRVRQQSEGAKRPRGTKIERKGRKIKCHLKVWASYRDNMVYRYITHTWYHIDCISCVLCDIKHTQVKVSASYSFDVRTCPSRYPSETSPIKWALPTLLHKILVRLTEKMYINHLAQSLPQSKYFIYLVYSFYYFKWNYFKKHE